MANSYQNSCSHLTILIISFGNSVINLGDFLLRTTRLDLYPCISVTLVCWIYFITQLNAWFNTYSNSIIHFCKPANYSAKWMIQHLLQQYYSFSQTCKPAFLQICDVKDKLTFDRFRGRSRQNKNTIISEADGCSRPLKTLYSNKTSKTTRIKYKFTSKVHNQNCPKHIPHPNITQ